MQIPALTNLMNERDQLTAEARSLREQGRAALAIAVEREARVVQQRLEAAAAAYQKLGF